MLLFCLFAICAASVGYVQSCAQFRFPSLESSNLTLISAENSKVTLPFILDRGRCPDNTAALTSYVNHPRGAGDALYQDYCAVTFGGGGGGGCSSHTPEKCQCRSKDTVAVAEFTKTVSLNDSGTWVWRTGDGSAHATVVFHIYIPEAVTTVRTTVNDVTTAVTTTPEMTTDSAVESSSPNFIAGKMTTKADYTKKSAETEGNDVKEVDDDKMSSAVMTGIIVACANLVTIVVIGVLFFVCRRRREKKKTARNLSRRLGALPAPPTTAVQVRPSNVTEPQTNYDVTERRESSSHWYQSAGRPETRIYEEITETRTAAAAAAASAATATATTAADQDDAYLTPVASRRELEEPQKPPTAVPRESAVV